ncbi:hypothetical protein AMECASPLE_036764 [Ameca splendens]|uniref:Uncharacterized protein n=1 Tax=Ameca splendens TaxID=208324 RepID=A0ABV1A685_9TELE
MGSVSECTESIVVYLYVGCWVLFVHMRVGMCDCDCVHLFLCQVESWAATSPGSSYAPHQMWGIFPPHLTTCRWLVSAQRCVGGSPCPGLGALVCAGSLLVAAWQGMGPLALSGLCWGWCAPGSWVSGSMAGSGLV